MDLIRQLPFAVLALTACSLSPSLSGATIISQNYSGTFPAAISGTLPNQGTALEETFNLPAMSTFTVFTTSYATGGFIPNLILFNATGYYVTSASTPGTSPVATVDPMTGMALDGYFTASGLAAGQYTVALTDFQLNQSITATNLSDGFASNYGDGVNFVDPNGLARTGSYSLTAQLRASSQTPEPATFWLLGPIVIAFWFAVRNRRARVR